MSITITTAAQRLEQAGIDPNTAWADDPGLTNAQRAALRASGRSETQRRYQERGQYLNTAGQGMGADGRQAQATPPVDAFVPAAAQTEAQPTGDADLEQLDGVSYSPQPQPGVMSISPVTAALLSRGGAPAASPGQTVIREQAPASDTNQLLPLVIAAGAFLL